MRIFITLLLLSMLSFSGFAKRTLVSSASEIASKFWFAGDTIVLKNGVWTDQAIKLRADGTANNPIVLMAETPGSVILNGTSKIEFSGTYIHVSGLYFKDGTLSGSSVISFRTSSSSLAENCRVSNCAILNYNPSSNTTDSKWVSIYGENNRIDHCFFENKTNSGTLLVVWLKSGLLANHTIDYNYFGYRNANKDSNGNELNGQEIIRIGDSSTSMMNARVKVNNNYFEHCNGEIEIISNKSCENEYKNNLFYECVGMLTLRHGNRCTVDGNYFFGNNLSNTGGVRIIGEDHKVFNNYFENLRGSGYRAALCIVRGKENSALNEYFQVKNANVAFNTFVDCRQAFNINYNSSSSLTLPPIGTTIKNNHVYNTSSDNTNVNIEPKNVAEMDVSWSNNLMNIGRYTNFDYTEAEVKTGVDPDMQSAGTDPEILEPSAETALSAYLTNDLPDVTNDIRGRSRGSAKTPGASQHSGSSSLDIPTKQSVGPDFLDIGTAILKTNYSAETIHAYYANKRLIAEVSKSGKLKVFSLNGQCLVNRSIGEGITHINLRSGIYVLRYYPSNGGMITKKVLLR